MTHKTHSKRNNSPLPPHHDDAVQVNTILNGSLFRQHGAAFGKVAKRLDTQLDFIPDKPRKLVMGLIMVCCLPLFTVDFLLLRGWLNLSSVVTSPK